MDFEVDLDVSNRLTEVQPLLTKPGASQPFPKAQVVVILFARLAEAIAYTQIFPYLNAMVEELKIASPNQVGFYSGSIDSILYLAQLCTIMHWGALSDRLGRKPVILIGLSGVSIATLLFGLSSTLWQLLLARILSGALCGNVAVIHSTVSDITNESTRSRGFAFLSLTWWTGVMIGSLIGGMLSHPAERFPSIFGQIALLRERPFLLPCAVSVLISSTSIFTTLLFMDESLPRLTHPEASPNASQAEGEPRLDQSAPRTTVTSERPRPSTYALLTTPAVAPVIFMGFYMSFLVNAFTAVFVLWAYTPLRLGGLQREPAEIGLVISVMGTLGIATFAFPYLHARFHSVPLFTGCVAFWGVTYALIPLVEFVVRIVLHPSQDSEPAPSLGGLWVLVLCILVVQRIGAMAYPAYMMVVKESMSNPEVVGALFGLATAASCLGEGTAPAIASSLFALSIDKNLLGGNLAWFLLIGLAAYTTWFATGLKHRIIEN